MRKICAKFVPRVHREDQKEKRCHDSRVMVELITCDESWIYWYDPETKRQSSQWKYAGSLRPKKARQSKSKLLIIPFLTALTLGSRWTDSQQGILCWGFLGSSGRDSIGRGQQFFKSGQWHFHQDNAPVHNSILVTVNLTKMGIKTVLQPPYSRDLAPSDFCLFPKLKEKLRGCRYETIGEMKEAVMKVIDTFTQEDFYGAF